MIELQLYSQWSFDSLLDCSIAGLQSRQQERYRTIESDAPCSVEATEETPLVRSEDRVPPLVVDDRAPLMDAELWASLSTGEGAPLMRTLDSSPRIVSSNCTTLFCVAMMVVVLLVGLSIGIYLLFLQNKEDNILPPVEMTPQVPRAQWVQVLPPEISVKPLQVSSTTDPDTLP